MATLHAAADFVERSLREAGWTPARTSYVIGNDTFFNISAEIPGATLPKEIVLFGAHYDSVSTTAGADDNGSGVATLLEVARQLKKAPPPARTVRLTFWTNEEPPYFQTENMGSLVEAKRSRAAGEDLKAVIALDTVGFYSDVPNSQKFPMPALGRLYPSTGNFLAVVANFQSNSLAQRVKAAMDATPTNASMPATLPTQQLTAHERIPGIAWSDHWSYWQAGYPAIMLSDTAPWRNPNYHKPTDTADTLSYSNLAKLTAELVNTAKVLAN